MKDNDDLKCHNAQHTLPFASFSVQCAAIKLKALEHADAQKRGRWLLHKIDDQHHVEMLPDHRRLISVFSSSSLGRGGGTAGTGSI